MGPSGGPSREAWPMVLVFTAASSHGAIMVPSWLRSLDISSTIAPRRNFQRRRAVSREALGCRSRTEVDRIITVTPK